MLPITRTARNVTVAVAQRSQSMRNVAEGLLWMIFWLGVVSTVVALIWFLIFNRHWFTLF